MILFIINNSQEMDSKSEDSIQVCIRVRPGHEEQSILQYTPNQIHLDKNHFGFDQIFPPSATQEQIFNAVGTKLITHTLDGYNGCVLVYGQTGSGKTYTMMGDNNGLMQKSFLRLFQEIQAMPDTECVLSCSYYQIYNEQIVDLLDTKKDKKLNIRQDIKKGVFIENMIEEQVLNSEKLLDCLNIGMRNRHVGETMMNRQSSRSHSIFTINFAMKSNANGTSVLKTPKLHFVDLAGSQRQKMTAASGDRLKQAGNINKSLTTLGMVINALACEKNRSHIPYRDSKLTSILRDSLGGNSKTFLIATISTNVLCFQETLSTLNFANRAKMVKVKALINQQSLSTNLQTLKDQISRLKAEIARLKIEKRTPAEVKCLPKQQKVSNYDIQFQQLNQKISAISQTLIKSQVSPCIEALLEHIQTAKIKKNKNSQEVKVEMEEEMPNQPNKSSNEMEEEQDDALIQYMLSNNNLLQKILAKINEHLELKEQLRAIAYQNTMTIAELRTPTRFERDQYEHKIANKEREIQILHSDLITLRNVIAELQIRNEELKEEERHRSGQMMERDEEISKVIQEKAELVRQLAQTNNLLKQSKEDVEKMGKKYFEAETQSKQNKQLYLYAEQSLETEKKLRKETEQALADKSEELEQIQKQYHQRMSESKEYYEELEERLRDDINVLTQAVEFNENLIAEYTSKLEKQKENNHKIDQELTVIKQRFDYVKAQNEQLRKKNEFIEKQKSDISMEFQQKSLQYEGRIGELEEEVKVRTDQKNDMMKEMERKDEIHTKNIQEYMFRNESLNCEIQFRLSEVLELKDQMSSKIQEQKSKYEENQRMLKGQMQELQGKHDQELQKLKQQNQALCNQMSNLRLCEEQKNKQIEMYKSKAEAQVSELKEKITALTNDLDSRVETMAKLEIMNEELNISRREVIKENYRLKNKYGENSEDFNKKEKEQKAKVEFYNQKFRKMKVEYDKVSDISRNQRERIAFQDYRIRCLEENIKAIKINSQNDQNSELISDFAKENSDLKRQLETVKAQNSYLVKGTLDKDKFDYKEKQELIVKKFQGLIKKIDPSKENIGDLRSYDDLMKALDEIESQNQRTLAAIERAVQKQQKVRGENQYIVKENYYLKQKISRLEQEQSTLGGEPRKLVKRSLSDEVIVQ